MPATPRPEPGGNRGPASLPIKAQSPSPPNRRTRWGATTGTGLAGALAIAVAAQIALLARWSGPDGTSRFAEAVVALTTGMLPALLWILAAWGLGRFAITLLDRDPERSRADRWLLEVAVGVALLSSLDSLLGRLGWIDPWLLWPLSIGLAAAAFWKRSFSAVRTAPTALPGRPRGVAVAALLALSPAIAVLLLAAVAAPGWLWSSEFGGYDSLSYHLALPKAWFEAGAIVPTAENVYGFLPSHLEAAFLHLMVLAGDPVAAAISTQCLHALLGLLTAAVLARVAWRIVAGADSPHGPNPGAPRLAAIAAAGVFLGTPWVVVVGSLAYNELAVTLSLAALLLLLLPRDSAGTPGPLRIGVCLGILLGGAIGAKATAVGSVALPALLLVLLLKRPLRSRVAIALAAVAAATLLLVPWIVHGWWRSGSPLFPLLASLHPGALWDAEQAGIFAAAHGPPASWIERASALWNQLLRYGLGPNPDPTEPWRPHWSLLWWLLPLAAIAWWQVRSLRPIALRLLLVLAAQLAFWWFFTHLKSRFMLPAAVPAALLLAIAPFPEGARGARAWLLPPLLLAWCLLPVAIFRWERPVEGVPAPAAATGQVAAVSGDLHIRLWSEPGRSRADRAAILATAPPWTFLNDPRLGGESGRVLLLGESRTFYLRRPFESVTVWDRGTLSRLARAPAMAPATWSSALRAEGFSLVLADRGMIRRWIGDGWWDPALPAEAIDAFLDALPLLQRFPSGLELRTLEGAPLR